MAVEAVDPASLFWLFSDFRNSESVWLYASAVEKNSLAGGEKIVILRIYQVGEHQAKGSWCYVIGKKLHTYCRFGVRNEFWMTDQIAK